MATNAQGVIVEGIKQLLLGQEAPATSGFWPQYLLFDAALLICSALAVWSLGRLLRSMHRGLPRGRLTVFTGLPLPLLWEVALPLGLLIGFPHLAQASWPLALLFFPDLGFWLLGVCAILLATGGLRLLLALPAPAGALRTVTSHRPLKEGPLA